MNATKATKETIKTNWWFVVANLLKIVQINGVDDPEIKNQRTEWSIFAVCSFDCDSNIECINGETSQEQIKLNGNATPQEKFSGIN